MVFNVFVNVQKQCQSAGNMNLTEVVVDKYIFVYVS